MKKISREAKAPQKGGGEIPTEITVNNPKTYSGIFKFLTKPRYGLFQNFSFDPVKQVIYVYGKGFPITASFRIIWYVKNKDKKINWNRPDEICNYCWSKNPWEHPGHDRCIVKIGREVK